MDQPKFQALLKYYLSCMDAEQAMQLKLRKNQEHQTHIFPDKNSKEQLFSQALPELKIRLSDVREKNFILQRSADGETLIDLHYGFPIFKDERDMISPLFFVETAANFTNDQTLHLLPKVKNFSVNRAYFFNHYNTEEIQEICDELEGEFGSFEARMNAVKKYVPSDVLIDRPILFRTNKGGAKDKLRYELRQLFKNNDALSKQSALKFYVQGSKGSPEFQRKKLPSILEISTLNEQQEDAVRKGLQSPLTVVTGPPGTGKTQVVTALIASAIFDNQTVLFSSNNNMPVDGVYQRLGLSMKSGLIWHHTAGSVVKEKKGAWNQAEVSKAVEVFDKWAQQGLFTVPNLTYGIVTPFRRQVAELNKAFSNLPWFKAVENRFTIGTAHSFQGSECDILIYSPVVAENMEKHLVKFASAQSDLINVTVTRAKNLLYIIGDIHACRGVPVDTPLYELANYAEKLQKRKRHPLNFAENVLAHILDELKLSYLPQYEIGKYRLDFLVNAASGQGYDVEVDGDIHLTADAVEHDAQRDAYVRNQGLKVLRFTARDIVHKPQIIKQLLVRI
jgi:very-short-patch-repair endonuclease